MFRPQKKNAEISLGLFSGNYTGARFKKLGNRRGLVFSFTDFLQGSYGLVFTEDLTEP